MIAMAGPTETILKAHAAQPENQCCRACCELSTMPRSLNPGQIISRRITWGW